MEHADSNQKKVIVAILTLDSINLNARKIIRDKQGIT